MESNQSLGYYWHGSINNAFKINGNKDTEYNEIKISFKLYDESNNDVTYVFYDNNNEKINYVQIGKNYFVNKINDIVDESPDTLYAFRKDLFRFVIDESISKPQTINNVKYNCNKGICTVNTTNNVNSDENSTESNS